MKQIKIFLSVFVIMSILASTTFAKWIKSDKLNNYLWLDENSNTIITNNYFWAGDSDNSDEEIMYHAGEYGFIDLNLKIDSEYSTNDKGEVMKNNEVLKRKKGTQVINTTTTETTNKSTENSNNSLISEDSSNILYAQNTGQGRLLKNYITSSQNVEILQEKSINGTKKNNVINFKVSGSFISLDTKKYNKVILKVEKDKSNKDIEYELKLIVNGEEQDSITFDDDQYEVEQEFTYSLNDDVDIVMNSSDDSKWGQRGIYITSGRMSKYKEDDDE